MFSMMLKRALVVFVLVGLGVTSRSLLLVGRSSHFSPFTAATLPQRAVGDFDGDGRPDVARIDLQVLGREGISVTLSGSPGDVSLTGPVAALIEDDVDHDGDLDLLATTRTGDVLIWINDGHGQFTRRPQSSSNTIAGQPTFETYGVPLVTALAASAPALPARVYAWRAVVAIAIRPPTDPVLVSNVADLLPPLRAPPVTTL
jgi:hypothetical protein